MKCKVKPYQSVTFRGVRYNQGDEFEAAEIEDIETILEQVEVSETKEEEA
jgi:hypothetical protein